MLFRSGSNDALPLATRMETRLPWRPTRGSLTRQKLVSEVTSDSIIDGRDASMILTYYVKASAGSEKGTFEEYIKNNK